MDLPELALLSDCLGDLGGRFGVRVHIDEGKVSKDQPHRVGERRAHSLHDGMRLAAVGTLVVAVLDHGEFRVEWTTRVVVGPYGN